MLEILLEPRWNPVQRWREEERFDIESAEVHGFMVSGREEATEDKLEKHLTLSQAFGGWVQINSPRTSPELGCLVEAGGTQLIKMVSRER